MSDIDNPEDAAEYKRAYSKGKNMAHRLVNMLNGHVVLRSQYRHPDLSLLGTIVGGHAGDWERMMAFQKMDF